MIKGLQFSVVLIMSKAFSLSFTAGNANHVNHGEILQLDRGFGQGVIPICDCL